MKRCRGTCAWPPTPWGPTPPGPRSGSPPSGGAWRCSGLQSWVILFTPGSAGPTAILADRSISDQEISILLIKLKVCAIRNLVFKDRPERIFHFIKGESTGEEGEERAMRSWRTGILPVDMNSRRVRFTHHIYVGSPIGGAWNAPYRNLAVFDIIYQWNSWINAAITRTGTPACCARRWRSPTARSAWITVRPAPTPASTANSAPAASSGNSAAKRRGSGARRRRRTPSLSSRTIPPG